MELNKIYCMDCLEGMKQLVDNSIDLILIDPPYNTGMKEKSSGQWLCSFFNDNLSDSEYEKLMKESAKELFRILKINKPCYVFIDWRNYHKIREWFISAGFDFKQVLVWDKIIHGLNYQNYAYTFELICYFVKGVYFHKRIKFKKDIIHISRVNSDNEYIHETVKPLLLLRNLIYDNSDENDIVLDCFMGSGTLAVACKQIKRNFVGFEIIQEYVDIANRRLAQSNLLDITDAQKSLK